MITLFSRTPILHRLSHYVAQSFLYILMLMAPALQHTSANAEETTIEQQTRQIIESQLAAFARDDSQTAFSFASRNIQVMFGDHSKFLEMVKKDYNVVYRPQMVKFIKFIANEEQAAHTLQMVDENKTLWFVYYRLINTGKTGWKISSCQIEKAKVDLI